MAQGHGHVITLTHYGTNEVYAKCSCGTESTVMEIEPIGKWIRNHRFDNFWRVRLHLLTTR